jgi:prenyltransferase beta subunit
MKKIIVLLSFVFLFFGLQIKAFTPLTLVSYEVSETSISPDGDGIKDIVNIDIKYSEEVKSGTAKINIIDLDGNNIKNLYTNTSDVTNPQNKIWDGKDNEGQVVPNGLYSIEILGVALADETNIITDTSKTISVENNTGVTLTSLSITKQATKLDYVVGDELDITGLEITGIYSDDSINIETITITNITGFDSSVAVDNQVLTITIGEYTVTYSINISINNENPSPTLANISITKPASKLDYKVGEVLDIEGLEVTGTYSDDSTKVEAITISNITGFDSSTFTSGQILTITVGESTITYTINILKEGDTDDDIFIDEDVTIKSSCEVKDTDGVTHAFPEADSSVEYLAICALAEALEEGIIDELSLKNDSSFGLYVENINNIKLRGTEYWAVYLNDEYASCGVGCLPIFDGDTLSFILTDWMTETESSKINLNINISNNQGRSYSGSSVNKLKDFSIENAISFLSLEQDKDESLGGNIYVDWVSVALGKKSDSSLGKDLIEYLKSKPVESLIVTENIRRSMALMALDINPYDGTEINYIKKIIDSFNGEQFQDDSLSDFNDDIFALIVLKNAGYDEDDEIIKKTISYVISNQSSDGSWGSVDMTSAGIMALNNFIKVKDVENAISKALVYLEKSQNDDGGFANIFSTSWAIQALSLYDSHDDEVREGIQYLADNQEDDGGLNGVGIGNRIWATAYAIPAVLKLSWVDILNKFEKPKEVVESSEKLITSKKVYTYLDFIDQVNNEIKNEDIQNEDLKEGLIGVEELDLLANAGSSIEGEFLNGKNIIIFISLIIAIFLGGFVIKRKFW